ncbi:SMI1/KNR4 family protein [Actinomadura madurae]|uniref:SMI1/KNR4 family protein n=1 Tax=Actinomadura madurae TaxID=1993 RepID=UPI000D9DDBD9|nr:SMI1/KNR4 family protein [Actinomadura madurae]SPT51996.1 Uncharacterised protein [Actinomadura madurae]
MPHAVAARFQELARVSDGRIGLLPAVPDDEMSSWATPVPEDVRAFLGTVGGFTIGDRHVFDFNHPDNHVPVANENWPLGADSSTYWLLHSDGSATTYYVDVENGAWGRVFSFWEEPHARLVAPSLLSWADNLASGLEAALRTDGDLGQAFSDWLFGNEESLSRHPENTVQPMPAATARVSGDPEIAAAAAHLPDDAFLADLRKAVYPTEIPFASVVPYGEEVTYARSANGRFLTATIIPDP